MLKNSVDQFGKLTKLLHWTIFFLFVLEYFLVYRREYFPKESPEKLQYILLHKSLGVTLLVLAFCMILWRQIGTRPVFPSAMSSAHRVSAKAMHFLLYVVMLIQPISGILMSQFSGRAISVFSLFQVPTLVQKNEALGNLAYNIHVWDSYAIIALVSLHVLAALYHHFVVKDNILKRML